MAAPSSMVTVPFVSTDIGNNLGGIYLDNGSITSNGSGTLTPAVSSASVVAGGRGTITVTTGSTLATSGLRVLFGTVTAGATATNITLATGIQGQELTFINGNTTGTSTIIITGNVVQNAVASITVSGLGAARLIFDATVGSWVRCV